MFPWVILLPPPAPLPTAAAFEPSHPMRPVHTYSIVARDKETGALGVAVQSHWFSVGSVVPWAEAGVGAVATQSFVDPSYGPLGLALIRTGRSAPEALKGLLAAWWRRPRRRRTISRLSSQTRGIRLRSWIEGAKSL